MRAPAQRLIEPGIVLAVFVADRLTKAWAQRELLPVDEIRVLPFFHLTYVENTGAAWGALRGRNVALIGISLVLLATLLHLRRKWAAEADRWTKFGLVLVVGGALGNLYDRIALGYVVDFLDFFIRSYHWPVFNVADSCISVGAACLAWGLHRQEKS